MPHALFRNGSPSPIHLLVAAILVALPVNVAHGQGAEQANDGPSVDRTEPPDEPTWLGVVIADDTEGSDAPLIERVVDKSPASRAGLRAGDQIVRAGGEKVEGFESLRAILENHAPGDELSLRVRRNGETKRMTAVLSLRPASMTDGEHPMVGRQLPSSIRLKTLDGNNTLSADDLVGRPLVLEFWATWCTPCRRTSETLSSVKSDFGDDIRIVGVSAEKRSVVTQFLADRSVPYDIALDVERTTHRALSVTRFPTLVVVDRDGDVAAVFTGTGHAKQLREAIRGLLN